MDIAGLPVSYENYYNSFEARGGTVDEVMNSFIQLPKFESNMNSNVKPFIKKYCFTSYFTASNFNMLCKISKKPFKNVFSFKLEDTGPYPTKCLMHDSGHYLPVYMENFEGKSMKFFSMENIPMYRMISAFKLFKSTLNQLKEEDLPQSY